MDDDKRKKEAKLEMMKVIKEKAENHPAFNWTVWFEKGSEFEKMLEESIKKKFNPDKK